MNAIIKINYKYLRTVALYLITLPALVFAVGWLKWYFSLLFILSSVICLFFAVRFFNKNTDKYIQIKLSTLLVIVIIAILWTWLSGIGGFWAQSKDYPWRNAIFRDLILRDWPVHYSNPDGYMSYYIGYWLFPAVFGKLAYCLGANELWSFRIGNTALAIWSVILILVLFLLLISLLKVSDSKKQFFVILLFVFFSGMDLLGSIEPLGVNLYHIEWWADYWQYSSFTTCLFWVFNQSVIPWICMALLLQENDVSSFVHIGIMCLFSGPFPFVGYFIYAVALGIIKLVKAIKDHKILYFIKKVFSPQNIICALIIFPFIGAFLLANDAISGGGKLRINEDNAFVLSEYSVDNQIVESETTSETVQSDNNINFQMIGKYIAFIFLEFGIFAVLIARKEYKNPLFYVTIVCLLIFPFLKMGNQADFPMRASIPALFIMYVFVIKFILSEKDCIKQKGSVKRLMFIVLIVCIFIGAATPCVEIYRGCRQIALKGFDNPMEDFLYTLGSDGPYAREDAVYYLGNFGTNSPEDKLFFRYMSK